LITTLAVTAPEINPATVLGTGATEIRDFFTPQQVPLVIDAYVAGLKLAFAIAASAFAASTLIGFLGTWKKFDVEKAKNITGGA